MNRKQEPVGEPAEQVQPAWLYLHNALRDIVMQIIEGHQPVSKAQLLAGISALEKTGLKLEVAERLRDKVTTSYAR
jgi:hypothetical protein